MLGVSMVFVLLSLCLISGEVDDFIEKSQLLAIKKTILDPHNMLSSWKSTNQNHCSWFGVTCNSQGRVSELRISGGNIAHSGSCLGDKYSDRSLHGFGIARNCSSLRKGKFLGGKFPNLIGEFTELTVLSLPFNQFRGELPSGIWGLKNLELIDLEGNLMTANLSMINFSSLKNLQVLNLGFNRLFGEIPDSLSECKYLSILNLAGNRIGGSVPDFLGKFVNLKVINLSLNRFTGSLKDRFWSNCDGLEHVDFSGNFLNGRIPGSIGNCINLRTMLLFSNRFSGVLPFELGNLRSLEVLDVSRNILTGVIPKSIGNCVELSVLVLSSDFNDDHKYGWIKEGNFFASVFPSQVTMLPNLKLLWAPNLNLNGEFPRKWGDCKSLTMVNLAGNRLKGNISGVFENCPNLHFLNVSSNKIYGVLDEKLHVPCKTLFDVSRNLMFGSIPNFKVSTPCGHLNFLQQLDRVSVYLSYFAHKTRVTSRLPLSRFMPSMIHDFSDNNFTGSIPFLPMVSKVGSHYKTKKKINYAFLAGGNRLSGTLFQDNMSRNCNDLNGFFLNVSNNVISGEISPKVGVNWKCLKFLDASKNQISGPIPKSLANLRNLTVLLLNNNKLSGNIPSDFFTSKSRVKFNFSSNNLSGSIKLNLDATKCKTIVGNPLLHRCQFVSLTSSPPEQPFPVGFDLLNSTDSSDSNGGKKGTKFLELILIIVPLIIVIILIALIVVYLYRRKQKPIPVVTGISPPRRPSPRQHGQQEPLVVFKEIGVRLTLDTVIQATGNFTSRNCIGSGGFGSTYRAEISPGITVAVKRLTVEMCQGVPQFNAEIKSLGRIRHPNLITLIGYYASASEMFLIYNYLPGGNLEKFILETRATVPGLKVLHKIAVDVANALYFLHEHCYPRILHRDVKPNNILLDKNFNAYLSDFGLARLLDDFETHVTTDVAGTFGYVAPEYALSRRASEKSDVYSYGVMLLELISDKRALDASFSGQENGYTIVTWAVMLREEGRPEEVFTAGLWEAGPKDVLLEVLRLGLLCTADSVTGRPTMGQVVRKLKQILPAASDC